MNYGGFKSIGSESWKNRNEKKKHLCPICRIEIPNHPTSISIHEKSEKHIQLRNEILENGGRRSKTNTLPAFQKQDEYEDEISKIEAAAAQSFLKNDNKFHGSSLGEKLQNLMNNSSDRVDNLGYNKPKDDDHTFSIDQIKNDPGEYF